jgi:AbrB family looped-hinge helix DNA binding protein
MQSTRKKSSKTCQEIMVTVSPKGQITLPKAFRTALRITPRSKVKVIYKRGKAWIMPINLTLEDAYRSVPALKRKLTDKEISRIAKEEHVQEAIKK